MLRVLCTAIPLAVILLHLVFEDNLLWLISLLLGLLGFIFSFINLKFRANAVAWGLLVANVGVLLYSIIYTVQNFV
ncbi:hypothetical protein [Lacicoccus alkaliphilus]|uniref:Uncharacterized protein n=1 Tax=Lacicoccus alkaliphilus DSM 16010 TaxID=1123231 RepID=A0A1M7K9P9_9BACL|nr:hypothetical protein [Salinicoccus alkaliphilus]SHM61557.1 hypothetical protein SAMN02745189_02474 [Salinicoccus alkaliphilus DSM 16010]